jgi:peptidoglycan L-alanyl-D-glutamate endopeptidase CwlK
MSMLSSGQGKRNKELLATLLPEVAALAWRHLGICQDAGIDLVVVQALRTKEQQDALYAQGRTAPGRVVTDARPGFSWHNFGRAYDVAIAGEGGRLI